MADSTYRVGVLLDLAAGRFRRGAKAAAKDTDRLGGTLRKAAGSGSLMGRRVSEGARGARREVRHTAEESERLGRTLRRTSRDGEQSLGRLTRRARGYRTEMGLAARSAGRVRSGLLGIAGVAGGGFAVASGLRRVLTMEQRMERLGIQSGRTTEEMSRLRKEIFATANLPEIRLDPSQLLASVEAIVEKTGDLDFARNNLVLIAQSIQGSGGTGDALGRLSAELRKLGITDPTGVAQALNLVTAQGKSGAFTLGNMAAQGERLFSAFARLDYTGEGAVRQLGAISQMARQSTGSSEQAATAVEALLRTLSDAQKIDAIWSELGVNVRDATGAFRPLDRVLKEIVDATDGDIARLSEIFDAEAIRAISGLATAQGRADYERFLTIQAPADMLARDAARMAETSGAQIQETKTDVEDWMQDKLTGPLGDVVTALTSFKDELLVGVGLLAGSWYAFKGVRAVGSLLWRLAGRPGGLPPGATASPSGSGGIKPSATARPWERPPNYAPTTGRVWSDARRQEALLRSREEAARRSPSLMREAIGGTGPTTRAKVTGAQRWAQSSGPTTRAKLTGASGSGTGPTTRAKVTGGLWRSLARGLGPAGAGAVMGLTAHDIATGAIPPDQVAPEVGGLAGGLGGSWLSALLTSSLTKAMPGPIRFAAPLLAGLGGWMGGESVGRAAAKAVFDPGYVDPGAAAAARDFFGGLPQPGEGQGLWPWLQGVFGSDDAPEIGNWRGVAARQRNRGRLDIGQNDPEVWTPQLPAESEAGAGTRNRGRLDVGQNRVTVNVGPITVQSGSADPREVAEEVADEIERRVQRGRLGLRDVLLADPTPEATY